MTDNRFGSGDRIVARKDAADADTGAARLMPVRRRWPMILLSALYVVSLIDRLILAILIQPLKLDLQLSDTQVAWQ